MKYSASQSHRSRSPRRSRHSRRSSSPRRRRSLSPLPLRSAVSMLHSPIRVLQQTINPTDYDFYLTQDPIDPLYSFPFHRAQNSSALHLPSSSGHRDLNPESSKQSPSGLSTDNYSESNLTSTRFAPHSRSSPLT